MQYMDISKVQIKCKNAIEYSINIYIYMVSTCIRLELGIYGKYIYADSNLGPCIQSISLLYKSLKNYSAKLDSMHDIH